MDPDWFHKYILLVLRLNKLIVLHTGDTSLLDYYGSIEYQAQIDQEPVPTVEILLDAAQTLKETVADHGFAPARTKYIGKTRPVLGDGEPPSHRRAYSSPRTSICLF